PFSFYSSFMFPRPPCSTLFPYTTLFRCFASSFFLLEGISSLGLITASRQERVAFVSLVELSLLIFQTCLIILFAYWLRTCWAIRSEEHTSELQSREILVCRLLLEKKKNK